MNLDFNIFVFILGFVFVLPIIGYAFRFNIPISIFFFISGVFMLAILFSTDGLILNDRPILVTDNGNTFDIEYEDNVMDFSLEGENYQAKVFLIFVAVMLMVGGALVEVRQR
jgi:hypothetical protein